ncbi:MAG: SURF1 family protein, partial [Acidimicrobiales bacterium]
MYRFLIRPRWLVGHVVILGLVAALVSLGMWQLDRLDQRRASNSQLIQRGSAPARTNAPRPGSTADVAGYRFVLSGTFDASGEVLVRGRVRAGLPGYEVLTPLVVGEGEAVLINRGYVPQQIGEQWPTPAAAPPSGVVTVEGIARPTESGSLKASDSTSRVLVISGIRLADLDAMVPYDLAPVWVQAVTGASSGDFPAPLPPADLSEGSHLSYAIQWFLFSLIAAGGWLV